jgi:dihydrofolate reductase
MKAIFATDAIGGFGTATGLPWPHCAADMKRFKELTVDQTVVMGSGTWRSDMPKPLPKRRNIVLSRTLEDTRCEVYRNITEMNMNIREDESVWVIGGAETLWKLRPFINTVYLTRFKLITKSTVMMKTDLFLEGFNLSKTEDFGDHTLDIYIRA